jgi:LysM repeat protein
LHPLTWGDTGRYGARRTLVDMRSLLRPIGVIAFGLSPAVLISACGNGDDETANTPLVPIQETSYVVKEPATTTTTLAPTATADGGISPVEQLYTVVAGDALASIANKFGITLDVLVAYNEWEEGTAHPIFAGDEIRIPPDSKIPGADEDDDDATDETDGETESTDADTESTEADPETTDGPPSGSGDACQAGTHTITAEDTTRLRVAELYDVSVEALDAANANTPNYSSFYPGLEIVIPCVE